MERKWKEGDVAVVIDGNFERTWSPCTYSEGCKRHTRSRHWHTPDGGFLYAAASDLVAEPLVIINPADQNQVDRVEALIWKYGAPGAGTILNELLVPPAVKPDEPKRFGSVVEDKGLVWFRWTEAPLGDVWQRRGTTSCQAWSNFTDEVVVVREGV